MITSEQIASAKISMRYSHPKDVHHDHDDCIRIAYEWLDAQNVIQKSNKKHRPIKHIIEEWTGLYISTSDVELAASMHPKIQGKYPDFNLSAKLVLPSDNRLKGIDQAFSQKYRENFDPKVYSSSED